MLDLSALIKAQILDSPKIVAGGVPKRQECLEITRVAPNSPAQLCGLEAGHLLVSLDDDPAVEADLQVPGSRELVTYDPIGKQRKRVRWSGCDLGILALPTPKACLANPKGPPVQLLSLWNHGRFKELLKLTTQGLQSQARAGFLDRLRKKVVPQDSPLTALHGAALVEMGNSAEGLHWLEVYQARYAQRHLPQFAALVSHYFGLERYITGNTDEAELHLQHSFQQGELSRTQALWAQWSDQVLSADGPRIGHLFPTNLMLQSADGKSGENLGSRLKNALDSSFLLVGTLRKNDWQQALESLLLWCQTNRPVLRESMEEIVLVCPSALAPEPEDALRELKTLGITAHLLCDPKDSLPDELGKPEKTEFFALSKDGQILGDSLRPAQLWRTLERLSAQAPAVLSRLPAAPTSPSFVQGERGYQDAPASAADTLLGVPLWLGTADARPHSSQVYYLIPSEEPLNLSPRRVEDAYPQGWACRSQDGEPSDWPHLVQFERPQLETHFGDHAYRAWVQAHTLPPMRQRALDAQHFVLIQGNWEQVTRFGHLQTSLAACRTALRAGGLGVVDRFANRWLSPEVLNDFERDVFDVKDHIAIQVAHSMCLTQGLGEKFDSADFSLRIQAPHLVGAAVHLLNEIAEKSANGKLYDHSSLFRWRSGAHLCQLMFKRATQEVTGPTKRNVYEAVDMTIEHGTVLPSNNAEATLHHFTLGAPHWNLAYGWPAQDLPKTRASEGLHIWGIHVGESTGAVLRGTLGPAHKNPKASTHRWLFSHPVWGPLLRVETEADEQDIVVSVTSNTLCFGEHILTEHNTLTDFVAHLGEPSLRRNFVAPPDQSLVRREAVWVLANSGDVGGTLLLSSQFDSQENHWQSTLAHLLEKPNAVIEELAPVYGQDLLTAYVNKMPAPVGPMSSESKQLRVYLESSAQLLRQLILQFGKTHWVTEDLDGYSMTVGSYLLTGGVPNRASLEGVGLPAQIFLNAYHALNDYVKHPANQVKFRPRAETLSLDYTSYAAFLWLIVNITNGEATESELRLAVDLSQVFTQYKLTVGQLTN